MCQRPSCATLRAATEHTHDGGDDKAAARGSEASGARSAHEDDGSEERSYLTVNVRAGKSIVTAERDSNA